MSVVSSLIYILISCVIFYLSKFIYYKMVPYKLVNEIKNHNATAVIAFIGFMIGIAFILVGAYVGPAGQSAKMDLVLYVAYALLGVALMSFSVFVANKIILSKFNNTDELIRDRNIGTAAVHFGIYLTSGLIIAACVNGEYGGLLSTIIYYILGMFFLWIFCKIYDFITPYSIHDEIERDNYAVGIALAGNILAIGLILMKATLGDVSDIYKNIILYFIDLASIVLLLPAFRFILGNVFVKSINLNAEIQKNNVAAALIEFVSITTFALFIFFMVDFGAFV